jgi:hypothetical protein
MLVALQRSVIMGAMIYLYLQRRQVKATLIDPEALGATSQLVVANLKQAIEQRITLLQSIDYSQLDRVDEASPPLRVLTQA